MLFKDMTDSQLRDAYWDTRAALASWDGIATLKAGMGDKRSANKAAGGVQRQLRNLDIIVAISRKRGMSLAKETVAP